MVLSAWTATAQKTNPKCTQVHEEKEHLPLENGCCLEMH